MSMSKTYQVTFKFTVESESAEGAAEAAVSDFLLCLAHGGVGADVAAGEEKLVLVERKPGGGWRR